MNKITKKRVSVVILAFNHEKFIAQALDSILSQQVEFDYEIIVHDDASTDSTVEILKHYQQAHPEKIRLILQTENQFSLGKPLYDNLLPHCQGEYIAVCEGDDYWGDEHKLSIQVDYLDCHPDVFISGHDAKVVDERGIVKAQSKLPKSYQKDFSAIEIKKGQAWLLTGTWVFRNKPIPQAIERRRVINGDTFLLTLFGQYGGSHHHNDIKPAYYRVHSGGIWSSRNKQEQQLSTINTMYWSHSYYKRVGDEELSSYFQDRMFVLALQYSPFMKLLKEFISRLTFAWVFKAAFKKLKRAL